MCGDSSGRLFVLAANVNQGFMEYDKEGNFTNFTGANPVKATFSGTGKEVDDKRTKGKNDSICTH